MHVWPFWVEIYIYAVFDSFLQWARGKKELKVVSADVPIYILPDESRGQLHDIKVFVKFGPDDAIYDKNKDIRDKASLYIVYWRLFAACASLNLLKKTMKGMY